MKVTTLEKEIPLSEFSGGYVDVPRFEACCRECPNYGKKWACPPYGFDSMEIWEKYSSIILDAKKALLSDDERDGDYRVIRAPVKKELSSELLALEASVPGSLALFAGGCDVCAECARGSGEPCVRPELMRYSVESIGGDVLRSLRDFFGEEVEWAENGRLPGKYILLGALLKP